MNVFQSRIGSKNRRERIDILIRQTTGPAFALGGQCFYLHAYAVLECIGSWKLESEKEEGEEKVGGGSTVHARYRSKRRYTIHNDGWS